MISRALTALLVVAAATVASSSAQPTKRDSIVCQPKSDAAWLYQGDAIYAYDGTLAGFKGPNLSFDGRSGDLTPLQFQSSVCTSKALNWTIPDRSGSGYADPNPIKLYLADQPGKCLALSSTTQANTYLVAADCSDDDSADAQASQFFLQDYKYQSIKPFGSKGMSWGLQIYDSPEGNIIANPTTCFSGQTCQTDNQISLRL